MMLLLLLLLLLLLPVVATTCSTLAAAALLRYRSVQLIFTTTLQSIHISRAPRLQLHGYVPQSNGVVFRWGKKGNCRKYRV